ncbi:FimV/HubP family polar landmark protein [Salinicola halophyticus]|uniref:FimV/HubP family polar landmark protein n=1 Tax=Salinicola halophyticus TaxID=1808881 RepID=UPI000DA15765|nr:FimV/HubP family polar landmark protein [Salinicola halophyticus]
MRQWLTFVVGWLCLTLASSVHALGVGEPQQLSPLNRPLHVVLPLTDGSGLEASQISVTIADDAAYRQSGLTRSALTDTVSAKVVREGRALSVVLESPRRVKEPFLDLLLVVTWPAGQWQREISLLFDPVDYASTPPLIEGDRSHSPRRQAVASSATDAMPVSVAVTGNRSPGQARRGSSAWPGQVIVRPGDSLSTLAASLLPKPGVSRQSLMVALFQSNPAAFVQGDIDRLRAGVSLDVPASDDVAAMSRRDAAATLAGLSRTEDGRPLIDIVGQVATSATSDTAISSGAGDSSGSQRSARLATLQQHVSDLDAETERQRATIASLQAERDALQSALAAVGTPPAAADVARSDQSRVGGSGSDGSPSDRQSVKDTMVKVATSAVVADAAAATPGAPPSSSWSQRLLENLDWIGGAILILLLGLWAWQRRRQRAGHVETSSSSLSSATPASKTSPAETVSKPAAASRRPVAGDSDSASISQADIYMAYGRHAEARDWLQRQLAQAEDAHLRLGLLRALGELREMEALDETLAGFGDDASPEQRREGQALVDDYRARYVEESWQEATAVDAEGEAEERRAGENSDEDKNANRNEFDNHHVWSGNARDVDALFESQAASPEMHAADFRLPARDNRQEPVSGLFDDDWSGSPEMAETSLTAPSIDYQAPTLELNVTADDEILPSASGSSPARDASSAVANETPPRSTLDFSALSLEPVEMESVDDDPQAAPLDGHASWNAGRDGGAHSAHGAGSRPPTNKPSGGLRNVPAEWDVEALEFQSSHRDNECP